MTITEAWAIWPETSRKRLSFIATNGPDRFDAEEKNLDGYSLVQAARILLDITGIHGTTTINPSQS
jgi:hypothetical protein